MKQTLSVVISAYNEEAKLERTLKSVQWADEIVVVDNSSQDNTEIIAKKFTKLVFSRENDQMLNKNKNFGFSKAKGDWILNLDADEVVTPELKNEILSILSKKENDVLGYWISRKNIIFGKWISHGIWWPDRQLRFFRREKGKFPCKYIHEYIKVEGPLEVLSEPLIHFNYESVTQYLQKLDRCTTSEAVEYVADGHDVVWSDAIRFPAADFFKLYFSQGGYKDGLHGLVLSLLQSFYAFIIFVKLWELKKFSDKPVPPEEVFSVFQKIKKEYIYWHLTSAVAESTNWTKTLWLKIYRKILTR